MGRPATKPQRYYNDDIDPLFAILLRMGDDALINGQQLCAWCGHGPSLELDIALSNLALDAIGQARHWLALAGEIEGEGRDEDALAYWRDARAFTNLLLVEQPNGDFAMTMVRQFLFSVYQSLVYKDLGQSSDSKIADLAQGGSIEVDYHLRFAADWVRRLGAGTVESHKRAQAAVDHLWLYTRELFERDAIVAAVVESGLVPLRADLESEWNAIIAPVLHEAELTTPKIGDATMHKSGRYGIHSENLVPLLREMQSVQRQNPGLTW